jgi:Zn-dependent protease
LLDTNFGQLFIAFLVLVFSLTVHEAAHAWAADRLGDPTGRLLGRVSLNPAVHVDPLGTILFPLLAMIANLPIIGWAKPVPVSLLNLRNYRRDFLFIAAAGPGSNLLLAVGSGILLRVVSPLGVASGGPEVLTPLVLLLRFALQVNLLLAIFNLIPIPPLDGSNILAGVLPASLARSYDRLRPYGFLLLYLLMFTGGLTYLVMPPYLLLLSWLH